MTDEQLKQLKAPWHVIGLGGTTHGIPFEDDKDFAFDVVDAEGNLVCETDSKERAEQLAHFPELCEALHDIATEMIGRFWDEYRDKPGDECTQCRDLIDMAKEALQKLEAQDGKSAE